MDRFCFNELKQLHLFDKLSDEQLSRLIDKLRVIEVRNGEKLFSQGMHAGQFFLLKKGQVKLFRTSVNGEEKVIEIIGPGQIFAEALMFREDGVQYPVNAEAVCDSEVWGFSNKLFKSILHESVEVCFRLMESLSKRLHLQLQEIDRLTLHNATYRLVSYLLHNKCLEADGNICVHLTPKKKVIASRLSIKPETFSRILAKLSGDGLVAICGTTITIRDISALQNVIETVDDDI